MLDRFIKRMITAYLTAHTPMNIPPSLPTSTAEDDGGSGDSGVFIAHGFSTCPAGWGDGNTNGIIDVAEYYQG